MASKKVVKEKPVAILLESFGIKTGKHRALFSDGSTAVVPYNPDSPLPLVDRESFNIHRDGMVQAMVQLMPASVFML